MDWQKLKERVTEEVMRQLASSGRAPNVEAVKAVVTAAVTAPPSGAAPAQGASVPGNPAVPAGAPTQAPLCEVPDGFATDVLVVLAGPGAAGPAVSALVEAGLKVTVVASSEAGSGGAAEMAACYLDPSLTALDKLVGAAKAVAVPTFSLGSGEAVANLSASCNACQAIVRAMALGKRVIALRDGLVAPNGAPWMMRRQIEEMVAHLASRGIRFVEPARFGAEVARATGVEGGGYRFSGVPTMGSAGRPAAVPGGYFRLEQPAGNRFALEQPAGSQFALEQPAGGYGTRERPVGGAAMAERQSGGGGFVPAYRKTAAASAEGAPPQTLDFDRDLAKMIDHTLLKPEATAEQVTTLCQEAKQYGFCSVCINPTWVAHAAALLKGSDVKVCTVIGFPLGATSSTAKALEAADVIQKGATEVDMVLNVGALKSGQDDLVRDDIRAVVQAAGGRALVKVILETGLLTDEEKVKACQLAKEAGADFVKTSTGFGPGGATPADIALMRKTVGPEMGVKASGGIRDWDAAQAVVKVGATRIGASASINIVKRVKASPKQSGKY